MPFAGHHSSTTHDILGRLSVASLTYRSNADGCFPRAAFPASRTTHCLRGSGRWQPPCRRREARLWSQRRAAHSPSGGSRRPPGGALRDSTSSPPAGYRSEKHGPFSQARGMTDSDDYNQRIESSIRWPQIRHKRRNRPLFLSSPSIIAIPQRLM